jgi:2-polyprenyl-3-methyl-5-hydroxy-6-metoxy-1,4-benzoquinol methylase
MMQAAAAAIDPQSREPSECTHEEACDRVASLFSERWLRHYTHSKLRSDPVFRTAYELLRHSREPLLDVGCGVGLLPFYLRERGLEQPITGLDVDARKVRRAIEVAEKRYGGLEFVEHNALEQLPAFRGNIAVLDVLHYLPPSRQETLLREFAGTLCAGGMLLLRDCPRNGTPRFWVTYAGEVFAQAISWNWRTQLHFPTVASIDAAFAVDEFAREARPTWGATPFNNQLFVFRRHASAVAPARE